MRLLHLIHRPGPPKTSAQELLALLLELTRTIKQKCDGRFASALAAYKPAGPVIPRELGTYGMDAQRNRLR